MVEIAVLQDTAILTFLLVEFVRNYKNVNKVENFYERNPVERRRVFLTFPLAQAQEELSGLLVVSP